MTTPTADIGLIGLAVMGENLVLNMESHGFTVAVFNRTTSKVDEFVNGRGKGKRFVGCHSPKDLVAAVKKPRKVMMLVKAGQAVDDTIAQVAPHLEKGDILIDGGNTHFPSIAAKVKDKDGKEVPCCDWVGPEGAGHFVKMVHNGIEYGDMQLICESYHLLKELLGYSADDLQKVYAKWNKGVLDSYLIEITADILGYKDPETG